MNTSILQSMTLSLGLAVGSFSSGIVHAQLGAAVLPSSRSAQVGFPVTAFATIINSGSATATGCRIEPAHALAASFTYQTTNPATNQPASTPNTRVSIAAGQYQTFIITLDPHAVIAPTDVQFNFICDNMAAAPVIPGVNSLLFSATIAAVPDIIALAATNPNTGIVSLQNNVAAFSVASINLGAADHIVVMTDTGGANLPLTVNLCQTNPDNGQCTSAIGSRVATAVGNNQTPTFSVFASAAGYIPFNPADNRIFVRFVDSSGSVRGATSVAIEGGESPIVLPAQTRAVLKQVMGVLFGGNESASVHPTAAETVSLTLPCGRGRVSFNGVAETAATPFTIEGTVSFFDCVTINGVIDLFSSGTVGRFIDISMTLNGTLGMQGCPEVTFSGFTASTTGTRIGIIIAPIVASGTVRGYCEGIEFSCNFDHVGLEDEFALARSCQ